MIFNFYDDELAIKFAPARSPTNSATCAKSMKARPRLSNRALQLTPTRHTAGCRLAALSIRNALLRFCWPGAPKAKPRLQGGVLLSEATGSRGCRKNFNASTARGVLCVRARQASLTKLTRSVVTGSAGGAAKWRVEKRSGGSRERLEGFSRGFHPSPVGLPG